MSELAQDGRDLAAMIRSMIDDVQRDSPVGTREWLALEVLVVKHARRVEVGDDLFETTQQRPPIAIEIGQRWPRRGIFIPRRRSFKAAQPGAVGVVGVLE